jgi:hypothetical protein
LHELESLHGETAVARRDWPCTPTGAVCLKLDLDEFASLVDVLHGSCERFAELAAWLQQSLALRKGDRVALMMPNRCSNR